MSRRFSFFTVLFLLGLGLTACGGGAATTSTTSTAPTVTSVAVSQGIPVNPGFTEQLKATAKYSDHSSKDVTSVATWTSSSTVEATVSAAGLVTGVAPGTVTIMATLGPQSGNTTVTVNNPVTSVAVTGPSASVVVGSMLPLTAIATYFDGSSQDVTSLAAWTSSSTANATISTLGVVDGVAAVSSVTITAALGGQSGQTAIAVVKGTGAGLLALAPSNAWVYLNGTVQISSTYTPTNGTAQDVTNQTNWSSSNPTKASIDVVGLPGLVHGLVGDGVVIITGTYVDANQVTNTATTLVTVSHAPLANNTPLMDMVAGQTYMGFEGNLYEKNSNSAPMDHDAEGITRGSQIQPLDINGNASPSGAVAFISVGLSNTSLEFGGFVKYVADPSRSAQVNPRLAVLNGAKPGEAACAYVDPTLAPKDTCTVPPFTSKDTQNQYDRIRDEVLATATTAPGVTPGCGTTTNPCLSEKQVQAVWLKEAEPAPEGSGFSSLCDQSTPGCTDDVQTTEAYYFEQELGKIARALQVRYPNLKQVFLASRIYAGYIIVDTSPEPYAYEYGFSAKWVIQAQINQIRGQGVDSVAGDLDYTNGTAAWLAWGAYLWADGTNPRSDGLTWIRDTDYQTKDYQHPSQAGIDKVDGMLFTFFTGSAYTPWFRP